MSIICSNSTEVFLNVGLVTVKVKCPIHSVLTLELMIMLWLNVGNGKYNCGQSRIKESSGLAS